MRNSTQWRTAFLNRSRTKMRKDKNMKKAAAVLLALMIAGISTGAVFAYLTAQEKNVNEVTAANTDISISENFNPPKELNPGIMIPKSVSVTSHSTADCYVRVMVRFSSLEAEQFCESLQILGGWTKEKDGYYYWEKKLKPGESTGTLFEFVKIKQNIKKEDLEDFEILVYGEAVSCTGESRQEAWKKMDIGA